MYFMVYINATALKKEDNPLDALSHSMKQRVPVCLFVHLFLCLFY